MTEPLRYTPLRERHRAAGARMVPFAGFDMPVQYESIVAEHRFVRASAGLFDVSHMGEIRLRGRDALKLAQQLFTNDVPGTEVGRVRYGLLCLEDGGVVDDVTLYRTGDDEVLFCVNASNAAADLAWIREQHERGNFDCDVIDESDATALLALQGPRALEIAGRVTEGDGRPRRWRFQERQIAGASVLLSRTGYTGEDGYEIYAPAGAAVAIWDALLEAGGDAVCPAGLGARDTLRTEMAYPLYGHELTRSTNPVEAGLERFLALDADFIGKRALEAARAAPTRRLVGLHVEGRAVPRADHPITVDGETVGVVTSGTYGPSVERSIAIGYVPADRAQPGAALHIEIRGRAMPCTVTPTPFYNRKS